MSGTLAFIRENARDWSFTDRRTWMNAQQFIGGQVSEWTYPLSQFSFHSTTSTQRVTWRRMLRLY